MKYIVLKNCNSAGGPMNVAVLEEGTVLAPVEGADDGLVRYEGRIWELVPGLFDNPLDAATAGGMVTV